MSKFRFSVGPWNVHTGADMLIAGRRSEQPEMYTLNFTIGIE